MHATGLYAHNPHVCLFIHVITGPQASPPHMYMYKAPTWICMLPGHIHLHIYAHINTHIQIHKCHIQHTCACTYTKHLHIHTYITHHCTPHTCICMHTCPMATPPHECTYSYTSHKTTYTHMQRKCKYFLSQANTLTNQCYWTEAGFTLRSPSPRQCSLYNMIMSTKGVSH